MKEDNLSPDGPHCHHYLLSINGYNARGKLNVISEPPALPTPGQRGEFHGSRELKQINDVTHPHVAQNQAVPKVQNNDVQKIFINTSPSPASPASPAPAQDRDQDQPL